MTPAPHPVNLGSIERPLYDQLLVLAGLAMVIGTVTLGWHWGLAAALGVGAAFGYYKLLAAQVRRQFARGRVPNVMIMVGCLAGRQILCLAVPGVCFWTLGPAWLACLVMLVVARHWILLVAWPRTPSVDSAALAAS